MVLLVVWVRDYLAEWKEDTLSHYLRNKNRQWISHYRGIILQKYSKRLSEAKCSLFVTLFRKLTAKSA